METKWPLKTNLLNLEQCVCVCTRLCGFTFIYIFVPDPPKSFTLQDTQSFLRADTLKKDLSLLSISTADYVEIWALFLTKVSLHVTFMNAGCVNF